MNSDFSLSGPAALSVFSLLASFSISTAVKFFLMGHGGTVKNSFFISSGAKVLLKYSSMTFIFSVVEPGVFPSLSFINIGVVREPNNLKRTHWTIRPNFVSRSSRPYL